MELARRHRKNCNDPGHAHELTFSCYGGLPLLSKDRPCHWLCEAIDVARSQFNFQLWAYVLMPEHVHLLIWPQQAGYDIAAIRRAIKEPVGRKAIACLRKNNNSTWLQRLERRRGHRVEHLFWQSGGGYDRNVTSLGTLLKIVDYIHLNPVRRGLVQRAVEWPWSSANWFETMEPSVLPLEPIPSVWLSMDD